jgi:Tfp pilus assembly protein PilF/predicted aspartyl protease
MFTRFLLVLSLALPVLAQTVADNSKPAAPKAAPESSAADPLASAQALLKKDKAADALAAFKTIVDKDPSSAEAHVGLVRSLLRAHQVDDAEEAGRKALTAVPSSAAVHAAVGDVAFRAGKFGDAEAEYRAALKLDSHSARGTFGMARMMEMVSMRKSAKTAFAKAHELDPQDEQIYEHWVDSLPRAQQLKKHPGDHAAGWEVEEMKLLTALAEKKPWVLASEVKPTEIRMIMVGNKEAYTTDVNSSISSNGPIHISKGFGVQAKFNDKTAADLLLDTGADGIIIGYKLAEKIGVVKIADRPYGGIGDKGPIQGYLAWVDKIKIGDVEFHNCIVEVSSRKDVTPDAGLMGAILFSKFLITLDFREKKMLLAPLPRNPAAPASDGDDETPEDRYIAPEMQAFTKVYVLDDHIFAPVAVNDKAVGTFMFDTGADINSMTPKFAAQVTKASNDHQYEMSGVSGKVNQVLTGRKAIIKIGKIRIESHDLPVFPLDSTSNAFGTEVAGFIGILTLSQTKMTIDYRDGLVNLQVYDPKEVRE